MGTKSSLFVKINGDNNIFKLSNADFDALQVPIEIKNLEDLFYVPSDSGFSIEIVKSFEQGLAIVEHSQTSKELRVHFYNEKTDKLINDVYTSCNVYKIEKINENIFKSYNMPFYFTDNHAVKRLAVVNLVNKTDYHNLKTGNPKNFALNSSELNGKTFKGVEYKNTKMVGVLKKRIIDLSDKSGSLSPFMRFYLAKQTSYINILEYDSTSMADILDTLATDTEISTTLIIGNTECLSKLLPVINKFNINRVVLRDLEKTNADIEEIIKTNILTKNIHFLFYNRLSNSSEYYSRVLLSLFREYNTLGEFYYAEYDPQNPEMFYLGLFNIDVE